MRYALIGLMLVGCGKETEVTREYYRVPPDMVPDVAPCLVATEGCEAMITRLLEAKRIKVRKRLTLEQICDGS